MTSRVVHSVSWNDADLIVESTSERQHLDIKSPSFDLCVGEDSLRCLGAKGLEAALGIPNTRNHEKLHSEVTNPSCPALIPWLGNRLSGVRSIFRISRSEYDAITFVEKWLHLLKMCDISVELSASVKRRMRPAALSIPSLTVNPLP